GGMSDFRDNTLEHGFSTNNPYGKSPREIIIEQLSELNIPIVFNVPFGHIDDNQSFYHGANANLNWEENAVKLSYS
ncbi:MAG: hypothetical protein ACPGWM_10600, partial [Flavobacteriales bacterium]